MRRMTLTILLALAPAVIAAQQAPPSVPALPRDVRRMVIERWNGANEFRASNRAEIAATSEVTGNVSVLRGPLILAGRVTGTVLVINGDVILQPTARINGDLIVVGGEVEGQNVGRVDGSVRIYRQTLVYREDGDRLVALNEDGEQDEENWWRRLERHREGNWGEALRVVQAGPYNRVEGLPVELGPVVQRLTPWGSVRFDAAVVVRTASVFESDKDDLGHNVRAEVRVGRHRAIGFGARMFDVVEPVEAWQLSDLETALASFVSRRDYRDYYQRHGASGALTLYGARNLSLAASFGQERWSSRDRRNPFSVFNGRRDWRENPVVDEGLFHVADLALDFDTRTDPQDPWSGWFLNADVEHGRGTIRSPAPVSGVGSFASGALAEYTRGFFDFRRYNRLGPNAQVNMRLVLGGWLGGDALPLERRLSVDGPGTLPGFGFRAARSGADVGTCIVGATVRGAPAECDRIALAQIEYRGDVKLPVAGVWDNLFRHYRSTHGDLVWVLFADAGRGWRVGDTDASTLVYGRATLPPLSTFRSDVGVGLDLAGFGVYAAKAVSTKSEPVNFFVRLRHRF